jgi:predicted lipoprotein with Yx(FWY)xxD motif
VYDGHPLYEYSADQKAGEANGQGQGGVWFVVTK